MNKFYFIIIAITISLFTLACSENNGAVSNNETEEKIQKIFYDMETITHEVSLENGEKQSIATFLLFVESERTNLNLRKINFELYGGGDGEDSELEFYDSLDNFKILVNGEEIVPESETATNIFFYLNKAVGDALIIELKADVFSTYPEIQGSISVKGLSFTKGDSLIQIPSEAMEFSPEMGNGPSTETVISNVMPDGFAPYWRFPEITITNNNFPQCEEDQVQLINGTCVHNNCGEYSCGQIGSCQIDNTDGQAFCICPNGYDSYPGSLNCDYRLGRFDIETDPDATELEVLNYSNEAIIGEWHIYVNEEEDAELADLTFQIKGARNSVSNFRVEVNGIQFDTIRNYPASNDPILDTYGDMVTFHGTEESLPQLYAGSITSMKLFADIHGEIGDAIKVTIRSPRLKSLDVISPYSTLAEEPLALTAYYGEGASGVFSAVYGSGYLWTVDPVTRIVE